LTHLLTRQLLSSTVTIRFGGSRIASRRQIKPTQAAAFESPIPQSINEGGGDSGASWHCDTSSQMLQIIEIADLLLLQSGTSVSNGVPIGETAAISQIENKNLW
jgi:hypothetical protein